MQSELAEAVVEKVQIDTLDLPELEPYRHMKWQFEQRQQGIFVAEGEKVVRRLLESDLPVVSALLLDKWYAELEPLMAKRRETIRAYVAERPLLETIIGFAIYQGVLAVGRAPRSLTLDELLAQASEDALFVAVEGVSSAENMGGLIRNCAAFGVNGIVVGETSCSPYLRRAVRSSMGTVFKVPVLETHSLANTLRGLRAAGVRCIAAHPHTNQKRIGAADLRGKICIALGAEGNGLSEEILSACDEAVVIPMQQEVDSLNVATAGAVFLYETARQRGTV